MNRPALYITILLCWCPAAAGPFYVSVAGKDTDPGTKDKPFATIARARDAVRAKIAGGMTEDVTVVVGGGTYYLSESVRFDERDGGRNGHAVIYRAAAGETPVIHGGRPVTGWQKWKGQIYRTKVEKGRRFFQLFCGERCEPMARAPNRGSGYLPGRGHGRTGYIYPAGILPDTWDFADAQVFVWLKSNWFSGLKMVKAVDFKARRMELTPPSGLEHNGPRAWIQGVLELLDEPGEWCLKHKEGWLYYWPRGDIRKQTIVVPAAPRVLDVRGSKPDKPVGHIRFEGLTINGADFVGVFDLSGNNEFSGAHGAVYIENAHHITVRNCRIINGGIAGVYMNGHAADNTVTGCWIERAGFAGVYVNGFRTGDKRFASAAASYVNKGHVISNNFIHDCGLYVGHGVGIQLYQSGDVEISHNRIARTPRYGISYKGMRMGAMGRTIYGKPKTLETYFQAAHCRNIRIRYNDISNVCRDSHDFGAIESWGVGRDNVWEHNALHDIDKAVDWNGYGFVIYGDDGSHYLTMRGNLVYHCYGGGLFGMTNLKGIDNVLENNIVADCRFGRTITVFPQWEPGHNIRVVRNIFALGGGSLYTTGRRRHQRIKEIDYNLIHPPRRDFRQHGFDKHSVQADPKFDRKRPAWDARPTDYRLKADSPALKLGFKQIPVEKIGLKDDFPFDRTLLFRKAATDRIQAEDYDRMHYLRTIGGTCIVYMRKGSWARYRNVDFGTGTLRKVTAAGDFPPKLTITLHLDKPDGPIIATLASKDAKTNRLTTPVKPVSGPHMLYVVFGGGCSLDWFTFE